MPSPTSPGLACWACSSVQRLVLAHGCRSRDGDVADGVADLTGTARHGIRPWSWADAAPLVDWVVHRGARTHGRVRRDRRVRGRSISPGAPVTPKSIRPARTTVTAAPGPRLVLIAAFAIGSKTCLPPVRIDDRNTGEHTHAQQASGPKKARWSTAKKAEARKAPKKAHHRGQPDGPKSAPKRSARPDSADGYTKAARRALAALGPRRPGRGQRSGGRRRQPCAPAPRTLEP